MKFNILLETATSWICLSRPPMSEYCSVGLSSTSIAFTRESYLSYRTTVVHLSTVLTLIQNVLHTLNANAKKTTFVCTFISRQVTYSCGKVSRIKYESLFTPCNILKMQNNVLIGNVFKLQCA